MIYNNWIKKKTRMEQNSILEDKTIELLGILNINMADDKYKYKLGIIKKQIIANSDKLIELYDIMTSINGHNYDKKKAVIITHPILAINYILQTVFNYKLQSLSKNYNNSNAVVPCMIRDTLYIDKLKEYKWKSIADGLDKNSVDKINKECMRGRDTLRKQETRTYIKLTTLFHAPPDTLPRRRGRPKKQ
jgi:hypothetical protein